MVPGPIPDLTPFLNDMVPDPIPDFGFKGAEPAWQLVGEALWVGIAKHEKGAEVWNKHLDESK